MSACRASLLSPATREVPWVLPAPHHGAARCMWPSVRLCGVNVAGSVPVCLRVGFWQQLMERSPWLCCKRAPNGEGGDMLPAVTPRSHQPHGELRGTSVVTPGPRRLCDLLSPRGNPSHGRGARHLPGSSLPLTLGGLARTVSARGDKPRALDTVTGGGGQGRGRRGCQQVAVPPAVSSPRLPFQIHNHRIHAD